MDASLQRRFEFNSAVLLGYLFRPASGIFSPIALAMDSKISFGGKNLRSQISPTNLKPPLTSNGKISDFQSALGPIINFQ
ncbi:MAG: hypothetical protein AAF998_12195 [Bacteroidota bacterium]